MTFLAHRVLVMCSSCKIRWPPRGLRHRRIIDVFMACAQQRACWSPWWKTLLHVWPHTCRWGDSSRAVPYHHGLHGMHDHVEATTGHLDHRCQRTQGSASAAVCHGYSNWCPGSPSKLPSHRGQRSWQHAQHAWGSPGIGTAAFPYAASRKLLLNRCNLLCIVSS